MIAGEKEGVLLLYDLYKGRLFLKKMTYFF